MVDDQPRISKRVSRFEYPACPHCTEERTCYLCLKALDYADACPRCMDEEDGDIEAYVQYWKEPANGGVRCWYRCEYGHAWTSENDHSGSRMGSTWTMP